MSSPPKYFLLFTLLALLSLSACTQYRYIKPDTAEGRQCVEKLDARVAECETKEQQTRQSNKQFYEWQMSNYGACTHRFEASPQMPQPCGSPPSQPTESRSCLNDYKESFIGCGGRLEEIKKD
ncbi:hypothetical protein K5D34_23125 [Pseudomonas cichorii]|nr:hypothetical protein [Pseudomonas cichorii]MBX8512582.1 hypothetical protein [Pseudomonas cichorii]MBX8525373.1 hypothetical protein [Pseudomonas cichorii]MBX8562736.1 hypothetical protein [Pseudomonas cichorii]